MALKIEHNKIERIQEIENRIKKLNHKRKLNKKQKDFEKLSKSWKGIKREKTYGNTIDSDTSDRTTWRNA